VLRQNQARIYDRAQHWAKALCFSAWKSAQMAMFTAYFDASGAPDDPHVKSVTVAGFLASADQWTRFDREWKKTLAAHGATALHMKEFSHSRGEFKGWDTPKKAAFIGQLVTILQKRMRHSFAMTISMEDYRRNEEKYHIRDIASPLAIVGLQVVQALLQLCLSINQPFNETIVLFEDGDVDRANLKDWIRGVYGATVHFESKGLKAFEACDLLAYEHLQASKKVFGHPPATYGFEDLRKAFQRLFLIPHTLGDKDHWAVITNPSLEESTIAMLRSERRPKSKEEKRALGLLPK
jgi:hypothetical protein